MNEKIRAPFGFSFEKLKLSRTLAFFIPVLYVLILKLLRVQEELGTVLHGEKKKKQLIQSVFNRSFTLVIRSTINIDFAILFFCFEKKISHGTDLSSEEQFFGIFCIGIPDLLPTLFTGTC